VISGKRLLLLTAFAPAVIGSVRLMQLPAFAAANGAGVGAAWTASTVAFAVPVLALVGGVLLGWKYAERFPRSVAVLPVVAILIAFIGRRLASWGAPEEFYLLDDAKLWVVLVGVSFVLGVLVAISPTARERAAV
jgi:hypothetical protein